MRSSGTAPSGCCGGCAQLLMATLGVCRSVDVCVSWLQDGGCSRRVPWCLFERRLGRRVEGESTVVAADGDSRVGMCRCQDGGGVCRRGQEKFIVEREKESRTHRAVIVEAMGMELRRQRQDGMADNGAVGKPPSPVPRGLSVGKCMAAAPHPLPSPPLLYLRIASASGTRSCTPHRPSERRRKEVREGGRGHSELVVRTTSTPLFPVRSCTPCRVRAFALPSTPRSARTTCVFCVSLWLLRLSFVGFFLCASCWS